MAGRNEEARKQAAAGFDAWERLLADALERMRQRGELRPEAVPAVLATGLLASIEGGMLLSQARQDMTSLRVAMEAGLAPVRAWRSWAVRPHRHPSRDLPWPAAEEGPVVRGYRGDVRDHGQELLSRRPVGREVVLPAQQVTPLRDIFMIAKTF